MEPGEVLEYAKKLRDAGIEEVAFDGSGIVVTRIRLAVAAPQPVAEPVRQLTEEERRGLAKEKKRARYRLELGYLPDDKMLDRLP